MNQWAMRNPERAAAGEDYRDAHSDLADMRDSAVDAELGKLPPRQGPISDPDPYDRAREQQEDRDRAAEAAEERNR